MVKIRLSKVVKFRLSFRLHPNFRRPLQELPSSELMQMQRQGQIWDLPRKLGHDLTQSLMVTRCSSQDPGAITGSDIIVASSSLEVGYDDPDVGAILHHKKPTSLSSFIQRRGRAGRKRGVRPWTVVVLSDYGGDRWAFRQSERLFLPEIDSIFLPIINPYVLRVQAAYFLVDWLGKKIGKRSPFTFLKPPYSRPYSEVQEAIRILEDFIDQGPEWNVFRRDISSFFSRPFGKGGRCLSEMELDAIIWNAPRPLLRSAVPTLLRKLQSNFTFADPGKHGLVEDKGVSHPLPGYLPSATFAELDISEVMLEFPGVPGKEPESMSISRALFEACPGRVSKRFSVSVNEKGYWHHFSENLLDGVREAAVRDIFPQSLFLETVDGVDVYQPLSIPLLARPRAVLESSNSFWKWKSTFRTIADGLSLPVFRSGKFKAIFKDCRAFLHRDRSGIELLRYAHSCDFEIRRSRMDPLTGCLNLRSENQGVSIEAVGFKLEVDGIALFLDPSCLAHHPDIPSDDALRFRTEYFLFLIKNSDTLADHINPFLAEWLWQTSVAMLSAAALRNGCSLQDAQTRLHGVRTQATRRVLDVIFQVRSGGEEDDTDSRLKQKLLALWGNNAVCEHMTELETCLWTDPGQKFSEWLRRRLGATLAQAFRVGVVSRLNDVSEDDLMVDLVWQEDGGAVIYLTETNSGGLGQLEMAVHELMQRPDLFHEAFRHALTYCTRDYIADNLIRTIACVVIDKDCRLSNAFEQVRTARGFHAQESARDFLQGALEEMGFPASRSTVVSIITRLLQYGSSVQTDVMIYLQNKSIRKHSNQLGLNLDPRVFTYLCVNYPPARRRLASLFKNIGGVEPDDGHIFAILQRFFVTACRDACPECLDQPNRFNDFGRPSRALASVWLNLEAPAVSTESEGWVSEALNILREHGQVQVLSGTANMSNVAKTLQIVLAEELEIDYLVLPISIAGIKRSGSEWKITLQVKEVGHAYQ